ncbi:MAG TPA: 23S rRNA (pseudouridine(1915)-N(3))-methyltransferase RlmH [Myxococcaceae bacterium]|nr:23S rRNA (pseudouridine(1915)-N(3))-methyltransferase RlmH [Myxococcaceae bacterium]
MKLRVLSVGRDRSGWFEPGVQGYAERVRRYTELELVELPAAKGALPPADARRREGEALLGKVRPESWLVALDERGTLLDSVELSRLVATARDAGRELVFCIGGDEGLDPSVRERAWKVVALSRMTLPHRLARLVLLEQLYRAFSILRGEPYHK